MDDWVKWPIVAVVVVGLFFMRRGSRRAGYELGRKLRGGRQPKPPPRWVYAVFVAVALAGAVYFFSRGTEVIGDADGVRDRQGWWFGSLCVLVLVGAVIEFVKDRRARTPE